MKRRIFVALLMSAMVALSPLPALAEPTAEPSAATEVSPIAAETPDTSTQDEGTDDVLYTAFTKKAAYMYKAKKVATKGRIRVAAQEPVGVIEKGKTWTKATYDGNTGYFKTSVLTETLPTPTGEPAPTPVPKHPVLPLPASIADTIYSGDAGEISITAAQVITACVLNYYGLAEGYYSRVHSAVSSNIDEILSGNVPGALGEYAECIMAVASDISNNLTLELLGQAYNAKQTKTSRLFTASGEVIAASTYKQAEDGTRLFEFGAFTVGSSVARGTYYMQMTLNKAPNTRALYPVAESLTLLMPLKVAKMSSGSSGGGGSSGTKQQPVARLILEGVRTEPSDPKAGETFDVVLTLRNTSDTKYLRNMQFTYTSEDDALRPVSGSNIEYVELIEAGKTYELRLNVTAKPDLEGGSVKMEVSADFQDKQLNDLTQTLSPVISVKQEHRIKLDEPVLPTDQLIEGDNYDIKMTVYNLGRTKLYNVTAEAVPEDRENLSPGTSFFIGEMEPSTSKIVDLSLVPLKAGDFKADLVVTYETVEGEAKTETKSVSFTAAAAEEMDYGDVDPGMGLDYTFEPEPPTVMEVMAVLPWQLYVAAGALIAGLMLMLGVSARKKRMCALEDDEMD